MDERNMMTQEVHGTVWLVIKTRPRQEERARQNLEQQGFSVYLPRVGVSRRLRGQWRKVIEPLFPGYLFLYIDPLQISLSPVRSTFGVSNLVRFGHQLVPVPDTVIDFLRLREQQAENGANEDIAPFAPGDTVQVMDGPFAGLPAVFQMTKGQDRALLLISLLGRANTIAVPLDLIAPTG